MGWEFPWYTLRDDFDADHGVAEWHGTNVFLRDGDEVYRTYFIDARGDEALGSTWSYLDITAVRPPGGVGGLTRRLAADAAVPVVELPRQVQGRGMIAHVSGLPLEELLPAVTGAAGLLLARVSVACGRAGARRVTDGHTLTMERTYGAPAQRVFDAFTSEEVMRRWWHAGRDWETPEARVDLRVGGEVRVIMRNPHADVRYGGGGEYIEVDPPTRLAFTWTWDDDRNQARQLIEIDFEETNGQTTVRFTHSGLWDEEAVASHENGWGTAFDNLARALDEIGRAA